MIEPALPNGHKIRRDSNHYNCLLNNLAHQRLADIADKLFEQLRHPNHHNRFLVSAHRLQFDDNHC